MRSVATLAIATLMFGCAAPAQRPTVNIPVAFDVAQASRLLAEGANTIKGNAFLRQRGGGVVTCAGSPVFLVPATAYAKHRIAALYQGAETSGMNRLRVNPIFAPDPPEYMSMVKTSKCDSQGNFVFDRVADGSFYVTTLVNWQVSGVNQGGHLMHLVSVKGVQTESVVLSSI